MRYEILDISGDVGLKVYGTTCEEAFENAGTGMYSLITDIERVNESMRLEVDIQADSLEGLLVNYLNELIFRFDTYNFIGRSVEIMRLSNAADADQEPQFLNKPEEQGSDFIQKYELKVQVFGEEFDPGRHESKLLIKAATYHKIKIEKIGDIWEIDVVFDI